MWAADLLFSFQDEDHTARQFSSICGFDRLHGCQPGDELALIIRNAPRKEFVIAFGRLERWGSPQLERLYWLDIVVVVHRQRSFCFSFVRSESCGVSVAAEGLRV